MPHIVVIGAGVIGLSTALKILEKGHQVTVVAKYFPGDEPTIEFTSPWGGAHHVSFAQDDAKQLKMDRETFDIMWNMSGSTGSAPECFLRNYQEEYFCNELSEPSFLEFMPNYQIIPPDRFPSVDMKFGVAFTTLSIDVPAYLSYLYTSFKSGGGRTQRASIQHIDQVIEGAFSEPPDAIVVCAGLGARTLGGVEDTSLYPVRGQTILIRAPWCKTGRTVRVAGGGVYNVPRPSGFVLLGGTKEDNDWYPKPRPQTADDILERCLQLTPEILPPEATKDGRQGTIEDLKPLIVQHGCGFRPGRKGGIRLEKETAIRRDGSKIPIVFNYGHGGYGYQSSWGSASIAVGLLEEGLKEH